MYLKIRYAAASSVESTQIPTDTHVSYCMFEMCGVFVFSMLSCVMLCYAVCDCCTGVVGGALFECIRYICVYSHSLDVCMFYVVSLDEDTARHGYSIALHDFSNVYMRVVHARVVFWSVRRFSSARER